MISKKLEEMIDNAIQDGVITEKERRVLLNKAELENYDRDEFELLLNTRLNKRKAELKKELMESLSPTNKMSENGNMPNPLLTSSKKLFVGIQNIEEKWNPIIEEESYHRERKNKYEAEKKKEVKNFIKLFPVPSDKEDLLDFISSLGAIRHSSNYEEEYFYKFNEALNKAKTNFSNDPQFVPLIERYSKFSWENLSGKYRFFGVYAIGMVLLLLYILFFQ